MDRYEQKQREREFSSHPYNERLRGMKMPWGGADILGFVGGWPRRQAPDIKAGTPGILSTTITKTVVDVQKQRQWRQAKMLAGIIRWVKVRVRMFLKDYSRMLWFYTYAIRKMWWKIWYGVFDLF